MYTLITQKHPSKVLYKAITLLLIILLPFVIFIASVESVANQYSKTYLAELPSKIERLDNAGKKIVFVGGSALPFGLQCDKIESELNNEYTVVNFGLYATLGTKLMLDLSKKRINSGDIVIITPELNEQTYSLYFNADTVLEALDGFSSYEACLSIQEKFKLFYNYYKFAFRKIKYAISGAPDPVGIYRRDSFNEYGDIKVNREYNIMVNGVDDNTPVYTDERLLNNEFINYVNDYISYVTNKGGRVYFNYSPTNILALKSSKNKRAQFQNRLKSMLRSDVLCDIENCVMDEGYFYDTNFHLNSTGAEYYTSIVTADIKRVLGMGSSSVVAPSVPQTPSEYVPQPVEPGHVSFTDYDGGENVDYTDYFEFREVGKGYQITGVKDEYKDIAEVIVPTQYKGKAVNTIIGNAFSGCTDLKAVHIGKAIKMFVDSPFDGCGNLERIYLYELDGNSINVPPSTLLIGADRAKIYIPKNADYEIGYTWSNYRDRIVKQ